MKTSIFILTVLFIGQFMFGQADSTRIERSYWSFSPKVGYDITPEYINNTPYIDYKGGFMAGISIDKYWNWFGIGLDFDYIQNTPKSEFPTLDLYTSGGVPLTDFTLTENKISRIFYGIGPNFKYQNSSNKFVAELNLRAGMAFIKGGETLLAESTVGSLNYHAGYDDNVFSAKGQLKFNYFFNPNFGIHLGGYYMRHFGAAEFNNGGIYSQYANFTEADSRIILDGTSMVRTEACDCDISSIGAFAGVTLKINSKKKEPKQKCDVCGLTHALPMCTCLTCPVPELEKYGLTVTAKDKYSGELLANTSVALKNTFDEVIRTAVTNEFGVVNFDEINPNDYKIEGILYEVNLEATNVRKTEFLPNEVVQKTILYADANFIIKGKAFECNTNNPLSGTSVYLNGVNENYTKTTITDQTGEFILHLPKLGVYNLYGKKNGYMSNIEEINATTYSRERSLFVQLEICAREVNCETIVLENIHYDLDKFFIRDDAKPELNKVVQFLKDNPNVRIEILSHTDSRNTHAYNQTLSQNRAKAAIDYISSKGIDATRLVGIGYGETRLLNACSDGVSCSETEHQLNRRTEMRVICP